MADKLAVSEELITCMTHLINASQKYGKASEAARYASQIFANEKVYEGKASGEMETFARSLSGHLGTMAGLSGKAAQYAYKIFEEFNQLDMELASEMMLRR